MIIDHSTRGEPALPGGVSSFATGGCGNGMFLAAGLEPKSQPIQKFRLHCAVRDFEHAGILSCPNFVRCRAVLTTVSFNGGNTWNAGRQAGGM